MTKIFNRFSNPLGLIRSPKKLIKSAKKLTWKKVLRYGLFGLGALLVILVVMTIYFSINLPKPGELARFHPIASTKIYDRNGVLLQDIYDEQKRTVADSADIPKAVKDATIAIEDKDFYQHHGVKISSIMRSVLVDILRRQASQGGSTITQQLVRNSFDNIGVKKTFVRKIREVIVALQFERIYSKDQILTFYLNQIPYGNNNYGIEAATNAYYGKHIKDLNPDNATSADDKAKIYTEIATLVALPQAPTYYNPYGNHTDDLKSRRDIVLQKMVNQNYLSQDIADKAKTVAIADNIVKSKDSIVAPHFVFYVREQLVDLLGGGTLGEQRLESGGYKVTTTLDVEKQKQAESIIADKSPSIFKGTGASNIALVSTDATTGQILAMVGSVDYNEQNFGSVNVTTAARQPGSSFKPIVYATLFKQGWSPGSTIFDLESTYDQSHPDQIWPHNYSGGGRGPLTIRYALGNSLNISAVKSQALAGTNNAVQTGTDLGITTLDSPDKYGLAMVLGAAEVKMVDMVGAYGVFATGGTLHPTSSILKVEDSNGQVIQEWKDQPKQVLDPGIAYEISSILSDNNARTATFGARSQLYFPDRAVAVKTGTTSSYRDAWTIGYTPQIVTAVWVGNNNNKEMTHSGAGAMAAAPVWHDFMQKSLASLPKADFTRPDNVKDCTLAKYSNKLPTNATPSDNIVHDICTEWQAPTQNDDAYQVVKVYKPDPNLLATDATPPTLVLNKVFVKIHSERPNDPVWENPVQNWANAAGINSSNIPTQSYDPSTANDKLTTAIISPSDGSTVSGTTTLQATASSRFGVSIMTFYLDGQQIAQPNAPWMVSYDTSSLADGQHTFKAVSGDLQGQESSASSTFTVTNTPALTITSVQATRSGDHISVTITWTTNLSADGTINYGTTTAYGSTEIETNVPTKSHSVTISGLNPLQTYHYKITSKAGSNIASSPDGTF